MVPPQFANLSICYGSYNGSTLAKLHNYLVDIVFSACQTCSNTVLMENAINLTAFDLTNNTGEFIASQYFYPDQCDS